MRPSDPSRRPVHDALTLKRTRLLPARPFEYDHVRPAPSSKQPHVRCNRNDYSITHDRTHQ